MSEISDAAKPIELKKTFGFSRTLGGLFYRNPQLSYALISMIAGIFLLLFFGYPLTRILKMAFFNPALTGKFFEEIFQDSHGHYFSVFLTTFQIALIVTFLTLLLGYPMAALLVRAKGRWQQLIIICILLPFWTSVLVRTYAWMILLGRNGIVNSMLTGLGIIDAPIQLIFNSTGSIIGMTHIMLPYMIFPLYSVMKSIDTSVMLAAYNLGAKPWQAFFKVFFPLSLPGVFGGGGHLFGYRLFYTQDKMHDAYGNSTRNRCQ